MRKRLDEVKQVQIGLTTRCNSNCRFCFREELLRELGERNPFYNNPFDLPFDSFKNIFNETNLTDIQFCGNKGDAIFHPEFHKILDYAIDKGVFISLATNGSNFSQEWWRELGSRMRGEVTFAIDGFEDTHGIYRGTSFNKVYNNMLAYIDGGGWARWQFIIFKHNEHQVDEAKQRAIDIGCSKFIKVISRFYDDVMQRPDMAGKTKRESFDEFKKYPRIKERLFGKVECQWIKPHMKRVYLDSRGAVYPCCYICCGTQGGYTMPDFLDIDKELRNGKEYNIKYSNLNDIIKKPIFRQIYDNVSNYEQCNIHCTNVRNYKSKIRKEIQL